MPNPNGHVATLRPPWKAGESGNARGKLATYRQVLRLTRVNSPDAVRMLLACMRDEEAPWPARIRAAELILDRAWGKPKEHLELEGDAIAALQIRFVDTPGNDIDAEAFQLRLNKGRVVDADSFQITIGKPEEEEGET